MKTRTSITIEPDLLRGCKENGINMSKIIEEAIERELDLYSRAEYSKAVEKRWDNLKKFVVSKGLWFEYEDWKNDFGQKKR